MMMKRTLSTRKERREEGTGTTEVSAKKETNTMTEGIIGEREMRIDIGSSQMRAAENMEDMKREIGINIEIETETKDRTTTPTSSTSRE